MPASIVFTLFLLFSTTAYSCNQENNSSAPDRYYSVRSIVDGDTFWVNDNSGKGIKVRLIGIDAPETRRSAKKEVGYYGAESKVYLETMLAAKKVKLVSDVSPRDQYGRLLAYVYLEDGTFVNAEMIKNGYAVIMTIPPNIKYAREFLKLQHEAEAAGRGLWGRQLSR